MSATLHKAEWTIVGVSKDPETGEERKYGSYTVNGITDMSDVKYWSRELQRRGWKVYVYAPQLVETLEAIEVDEEIVKEEEQYYDDHAFMFKEESWEAEEWAREEDNYAREAYREYIGG